jgi:excisionase family DNA binding protein
MTGRLLTAGQVANMLGVPTTWVYEQPRRGRIPTVTLDRYRRYREEAIAEWVEQQEADGHKDALPRQRRRRDTRIGAA